MNRDRHLRILIGVDGACSIDAVNFMGPGCRTATGEIIAALGGQIDQQHDKPEARLRERSSQAEREGAR